MPCRLGILHASIECRFGSKSFRAIDSKKLPCLEHVQPIGIFCVSSHSVVLGQSLKQIAAALEEPHYDRTRSSPANKIGNDLMHFEAILAFPDKG